MQTGDNRVVRGPDVLEELAKTLHKLRLFVVYGEADTRSQSKLFGRVGRKQFTVELYSDSNGQIFRFHGNEKHEFLQMEYVNNATKVLEKIDSMFEVYDMYKYILNHILDPTHRGHFIDMNGQLYGIYNGKRIEIVCYGDDITGECLIVNNMSEMKHARIDNMNSSEARYRIQLMRALDTVTSDHAVPRARPSTAPAGGRR
jgi:hypothetical protein